MGREETERRELRVVCKMKSRGSKTERWGTLDRTEKKEEKQLLPVTVNDRKAR